MAHSPQPESANDMERFEQLLAKMPLPVPGSPYRFGRDRETHRQKSRMVEISSSGSGEGLGGAHRAGATRQLELARALR